MPPLRLAGIAVGAALIVAAAWCGRSRAPVVETAAQATVAVRITKLDAFGTPSKPIAVRDPARVRAIVEALGIDAHPPVACPPDYASAEMGLVLSGRDVYARRNVYVWGLSADAGAPTVLVATSSGCRSGAPADDAALRRALAFALVDAGS